MAATRLNSRDNDALKLLELLGIETKNCRKVVITFSPDEMVIAEATYLVEVEDQGKLEEIVRGKFTQNILKRKQSASMRLIPLMDRGDGLPNIWEMDPKYSHWKELAEQHGQNAQ